MYKLTVQLACLLAFVGAILLLVFCDQSLGASIYDKLILQPEDQLRAGSQQQQQFLQLIQHLQQRQQQQQQQLANSANVQRSIVRKYLIRAANVVYKQTSKDDELDDASTNSRQSSEQLKIDRLNQLLESLGTRIPYQAPESVQRNGRTTEAELQRRSSEEPWVKAKVSPALVRLVWSPQDAGHPLTGGLPVPYDNFEANISSIIEPTNYQYGSEELALHSPNSWPIMSLDYDPKRGENVRWENLRGMWGKRGYQNGPAVDKIVDWLNQASPTVLLI